MEENLILTKTKKERFWNITIPVIDKKEVIRRFHNEKGNFGMKMTWYAVREYFYWKGMKRDLQKYVNDCTRCMVAKPDLRKIKKGDRHVTAERPLQLVSIDMIGRLPKSAKYEYIILSVVDVDSKFVIIYPLRKATTGEILNKFADYGKHYGFPERILSDNATNYIPLSSIK